MGGADVALEERGGASNRFQSLSSLFSDPSLSVASFYGFSLCLSLVFKFLAYISLYPLLFTASKSQNISKTPVYFLSSRF